MRNTICHRRQPALRPPSPPSPAARPLRRARRANHERSRIVFLLCLLAACLGALPVRAEFTFWPVRFRGEFSPWRVWGNSGYQIASTMNKDHKSHIAQLSTTNLNLSRSARGFVWKPWVLRWNAMAMVGGTSTQQQVIASPTGQTPGNDSLTRNVYGGLDFTVLPESRYPLKVYGNRSATDSSEGNSSSTGVVNSAGQASRNETFGFSQDYRTLEGDLRANLRLDHTRDLTGRRNQPKLFGMTLPSIHQRETSYSNDVLSLSISKRMEEQSIDLSLRHAMAKGKSDQDGQSTRGFNQEDSAILNHTMTSGKVWSVNSLGNFSRVHAQSISKQREDAFTRAWQLGNSAFWRSEESPLFLSGSLRFSSNDQTFSQGGKDSTTRQINMVSGGNYQFSPQMAINATFSANHNIAESSTAYLITRNSTQAISANYTPDRIEWGAFMHNWFVTSGLNNHQATDAKPISNLIVSGGQSVTRDHDLGNATYLNFGTNQVGNGLYQSDIPPIFTLSHGLNGRITRITSKGKAYLDVALTDSRSLGNILGNGQGLNTQVSMEGVLLRKTTWQGHITSRYTRASALGKTVSGFFSSADFTVSHRDLFDIRNLILSSKVQIDANSQFLPLGSLVGVIARQESHSWWNFLDFNVGKFNARVTLGMTETQGDKQPLERTGLFLLQVQRFFDSTFNKLSLPDFLLPTTKKREKHEDGKKSYPQTET
ncbi:MAG: hypothetical protein HQL96_10775 [Magnetococcales bacterium]|nr:hypothetical protein [Magnetococcales bacterium]